MQEGQRHFGWQRLASAACAGDHLPEVAVAGAVMQPVLALLAMPDRRPMRSLRRSDDLYRFVELCHAGGEGLDDGTDLRRVDAPHPRVAELARGAGRGGGNGFLILELGDHAVRGHFGCAVAGRGDLELGAQHQRMLELAFDAHRGLWNRTAVRRNEVHQPE